MKTPQAQLDLLRAVHAWDPPVWIFGGFAEDALLHGRSSRPHDDIDLVVLRDELDMRLDQAAALGFDQVHVRLAAVPGRPLVVGCWNRDGVLLEMSVFERDESGRVYWEKPTPDGTARLYFPDDAFTQPPAKLEGVPVRAVSPRALYHIRAGVRDLFGGMRPKDAVSQAALRARFFAGEDEAALSPRILSDRTAGTRGASGSDRAAASVKRRAAKRPA